VLQYFRQVIRSDTELQTSDPKRYKLQIGDPSDTELQTSDPRRYNTSDS